MGFRGSQPEAPSAGATVDGASHAFMLHSHALTISASPAPAASAAPARSVVGAASRRPPSPSPGRDSADRGLRLLQPRPPPGAPPPLAPYRRPPHPPPQPPPSP